MQPLISEVFFHNSAQVALEDRDDFCMVLRTSFTHCLMIFTGSSQVTEQIRHKRKSLRSNVKPNESSNETVF